MSGKKTNSFGPPKRDAETREHLANERTLLAWIRTGVGLISVGLVVERAGALVAGSPGGQGSTLASETFGLALVALGCLALIAGSVQFFRNRRMIRNGVFFPAVIPYMIVVVVDLLRLGGLMETWFQRST